MVYWRKWWGVRNKVISNLLNKYNLDCDTYEFPLDAEDCRMIIGVLKEFRDAEQWETCGLSIWDYAEDNIEDQIYVDISVLEGLANFIESETYKKFAEKDAIKTTFYDSY